MEQRRKRSVFITVVSWIAIGISIFMIVLSPFMMLIWKVGMNSESWGGFRGGLYANMDIFLPSVGAAGIAFLVSAIGMLKRKNVFRIAFVILLGIVGAGFIVLGLDRTFGFGLQPPHVQTFSLLRFFGSSPFFNELMIVMNMAFYLIVAAAIVVLIVLIMSKRASADFRRPEESEPGDGTSGPARGEHE